QDAGLCPEPYAQGSDAPPGNAARVSGLLAHVRCRPGPFEGDEAHGTDLRRDARVPPDTAVGDGAEDAAHPLHPRFRPDAAAQDPPRSFGDACDTGIRSVAAAWAGHSASGHPHRERLRPVAAAGDAPDHTLPQVPTRAGYRDRPLVDKVAEYQRQARGRV